MIKQTFHPIDNSTADSEITCAAVSPDSQYYAWASLNGTIDFATVAGRILHKKVGNEVRGISISKGGKFWVYGLNKSIYYLDKRGEIFWEQDLPDWIENIEISPDASMVGISCSNGSFYIYSNEGNLLWTKNMCSPISRIFFSADGWTL
ncbi:MAG: hypothetical protein ABSC14_03890, partial [Desulfomonilia bacterium]